MEEQPGNEVVEAPEVQEQVVQEATESSQEAEHQAQQQQETKQQSHFRRLREEKERLQQERDELLRQVQAKQQPLPEEDPDDIADKKYVKQQFRQVQEELALLRLKSQFPDFEQIVTTDNIKEFRTQDPEMAALLHESKDDYKKAIAVYRQIKRLGIGKSREYEKEYKVVENNATKPRPLASVSPQKGDSPLSKANVFAEGLTPELRRKLLAEMNQARRKT